MAVGIGARASTIGGKLQILTKCFLVIPTKGSTERIFFRALPEITDTKGAEYKDEPIIGRSIPLIGYSHSQNRIITLDIPFIATSQDELIQNARWMRAVESAVYPHHENMSVPYLPPPVCKFYCGDLLDCGGKGLCIVLERYSVKFDTSVPWATRSQIVSRAGREFDPSKGDKNDCCMYLPYKFTMNTTWRVVYRSDNLPGQERIFESGV